jgi:hypothetical protein
LSVFKLLLCFSILNMLIGMTPSHAEAARQKTARKEPSKVKTTPPASSVRGNWQTPKALLGQPDPAPSDFLEKREHVVQQTKRGDTLPELVSRLRLPHAEKQVWTRSIKRNFGALALPAGKEIHFYFSKPVGQGLGQRTPNQLKALEIDYNDASTLTWEKGIKGILFQQREKPYDVELKTASAIVEDSLLSDGQKAGIHPALLSQLADIFAWDIDLEKEIHQGDSFKIVYEQKSRKGQEAKASLRILAAELINAGQKLTAIYFEKQRGHGNYYNLEGRSLARSFLRFPLEFTSISSYFTHSTRYSRPIYPILGWTLPRKGELRSVPWATGSFPKPAGTAPMARRLTYSMTLPT